ncbi:MAG: galactokinase [Chloroflexi bacterium]|nr:galactokinase [Chloroflexota bacterium]
MSELADSVRSGQADSALAELYGSDVAMLGFQRRRYTDLLEGFAQKFPGTEGAELFSVPGRTEVGGNHTDHNAGRILAGAVDLDIAAVAARNPDGLIRVRTDQYPDVDVRIDEPGVVESEQFTPASLARGVCARMQQLGYKVGGFDACTQSTVPEGSGLSSSAAFEVLVAAILNYQYNDAAIDPVTIAQIAQFSENEYFGKPCGLMDQTTCSVGGLVTIDFEDFAKPIVEKVDYDFAASGYSVVIVNTGGSHADLHHDYIALEHEMKSVARALGGDVLRRFSRGAVMANLPSLRTQVSDRAILRAFHFYDDDQRVVDQVAALREGDFDRFLELIIESGISSWMLCQNCYSCSVVHEQGISIALAVSEDILKGRGAWRVHGGGFAGTIQAFVPAALLSTYIERQQAIFGADACHQLMIRPVGATQLIV